jgi:hypothetical protein
MTCVVPPRSERVHNQYVQGVTPRAVAFGEQWDDVKKSRNIGRLRNAKRPVSSGNHTAVAADSKLVVSFIVGQRTYEQTLAVLRNAKDRLRPGHVPAIFTDAFASYESALLEGFGRRYPAPGRSRRPIIRWRQGLASGHVKKCDRGGRVDHVEVRAVHGKARLKHVLSLRGSTPINTSVGERHHGTSC